MNLALKNKATAILILNHFMDKSLRRLYEQIRRDCGPEYDIYLLSDRTRKDRPYVFHTPQLKQFRFTRNDLESLGYPGKQNLSLKRAGKRNMKLGNAELPVLLFKAAHPEYEHYWIVEYDVRFSGNWNLLFSHFLESPADLLGTTLSTYPECPQWSHWHTVKLPAFNLSREQLVRGFFPVYRISGKALDCLHREYQIGCFGHMETLMPSLLFHSGLLLEDIGGNGKFVVGGNENIFYTNNPMDNSLAPGTFIYRPWLTASGTQPNMLWHPVKKAQNPLLTFFKERVKRVMAITRNAISRVPEGASNRASGSPGEL